MLCLWIAATCLLASCGQSETGVSTGEENGAYTLYTGTETTVLQSGEKTIIPLNYELKNKNHITMYAMTDVNLVGYIRYEAADGSGKTNAEKIFIEKGNTSFSTFLDAFRVGAKGDFEKRLLSIELQNVANTVGKVTVKEIEATDRAYVQTQTLFIQDTHLKIGARLGAGGALTHIEKLNDNVVEYIDRDGVVRIENGIDKTAVKMVTDEVNLVNIYDWGREIQQSYYIPADESNGYAPTEEIKWQYSSLFYNPVQAGSAGDKQSQIIDYKVDNNTIWVKTRATEWFFDNTLSDSYMENIYTLIDGVLLVSNRFVNFSGFTGTDALPACGQEMPAIYIVHPLNYFYCETIHGTIKDSNVKTTVTKKKIGLNHSVDGDYYYVLDGYDVPEGWVAYVNDKEFGVGVYMPNAARYIASRNGTPSNYSNDVNAQFGPVHDLMNVRYCPSAYVFNYGYLCPQGELTIKEYTPLEYTYAICVGEVAEMRSYFKQIERDGIIVNEVLKGK